MRRRDYRDYKSYSNKETKENNDIQKEVKKVDVPVEDAGQVEEPKKTIWKGKVTNCEMVNVRTKASKDLGTPITAILPKDQEVFVDMSKSTDDYYAIETEQHVDGFIKRDFLFVYEE